MWLLKFSFIALTTYVVTIEQICALQIDTMDTFQDKLSLRDPSWSYFSSGILKSHFATRYTANRNKTLILSAPQGYSVQVAIRLLDLRPNSQDYLKLSAKGTMKPFIYINKKSYRMRIYDSLESRNTFYAPDGQLNVTFYTGPGSTWDYEGFELIYTVQANWTRCSDYYHCRNGRCIARTFICDGHNHCGDRSDQNNCYSPDPPQARSIGGVVGGVVFLMIAIGCAIFIIVRRAMRNKTETRTIINHPPPPTSIQGYPPPYPEHETYYPPPPPPYSPYNQGVINPGYQ